MLHIWFSYIIHYFCKIELFYAGDRLGDNYFKEAEVAITTDPNLNLIYSNQHFFGESDWFWNVSEDGIQKPV
jgi:hypothetical protein